MAGPFSYSQLFFNYFFCFLFGMGQTLSYLSGMNNKNKNKMTNDYMTYLMNLRNDFYNRGLEAQAILVQKDIDKLIENK